LITDVKVNAQELKITSPKKIIYVKQRIKLKVSPKEMRSKITWKSTNSKIAIVSKLGVVTGKRPGKVKIYASIKSNKRIKNITINVKKFKEKRVLLKGKSIEMSDEIYAVLKTYKVFRSRNEVKKFISSVEKINGSDFTRQDESKKLLRYKKNLFKSKAVCLVYIGDDIKGHPNKVNGLEMIQSDKGNIIGKLQINVMRKNPKYNYPEAVNNYFAIFEISNKSANDIQYFKISRNYY
jgi:hypothetical protein